MVNNSKTNTTLFLVPTLSINKAYLDKFGFVNAYLRDVNHDVQYEDAIYLLFKPEDLALFEKFVQSERRRTKNLFIEDYDCGYGYVVLVYKIPPQYLADYKLFLEGKYSKFSKEFMDLFDETVPSTDEWGYDRLENSLYFHIFHRSKAMKNYLEEKFGVELEKDSEYWSIPNPDGKEKLDIHTYLQEKKLETHG